MQTMLTELLFLYDWVTDCRRDEEAFFLLRSSRLLLCPVRTWFSLRARSSLRRELRDKSVLRVPISLRADTHHTALASLIVRSRICYARTSARAYFLK